MKFNTKTIHAGIEPDPSTGAIMTPIFQTSTFVQKAPGDHQGFEYARTQNPTRSVLEANIAALENAKHGFAFGSGMAAMDTIIKMFESGDEILSVNDLYGGSYRLLTKVYRPLGIESRFVDMTDPNQLENQISKKTKLIWIETPTNPVLTLVDIQAICEIAHRHNVLVCVDNTFATPYNQNPMDLGADMVMHSATKYLGGHSDVIMGMVVTSNPEIAEKLAFLQNSCGAVPGPQDCFLMLRGIKTLHLRVERASQNAQRIAEWLDNHPLVEKVIYPGLPSHPQHELAQRQMRTFGGMVSFDLKANSVEAAQTFMSNTYLFSLAESLGGVESLIGHPASMTHASIPREERLAAGLTDSLIRLSVGIEDVDDLIEDLQKGFDAL